MTGTRVGAELHLLRIALIGEHAVVEHDHDHMKPAAYHRLELGPGMGEASIPDKGNDRMRRARRPGTDSKRQAPAKPGESAWCDKAHSGRQHTELTYDPHGRITGVGHD